MEKLKTKIRENNNELKKWLDANFQELDQHLQDFYTKVKDSKRIAINVNLESLNLILIEKAYKNIFQLGYDSKSIKSRYNVNVKALYFEKLIAFTEVLDVNKEIKYGSLNIGGLGCNYPGFGSGQIVIVLKEDFSEKIKSELFCLKRFSLNYFTSDLIFKEQMLIKESSTWEFVEILALHKHLLDLQNTEQSDWNDILSNKRGWLEILIYNNIYSSDFQEIRIKSELFSYLSGLKTKENLSNYEKALNLTFQAILKNTMENDIPVKSLK